MKRIKNIIAIGFASLLVSACSLTEKAQDREYKKIIDISIDYGNIRKDKVTPVFSEELNLEGIKLLDKKSKEVFNENYVCGEQIEVYYKDKNLTEIDYAVVSSEGLVCVKMTNLPLPGSGEMDVFSVETNDKTKPHIVGRYIEYVINEDDSFTLLNDLEDNSELYGVYRIEDIYTTEAVDGSELEGVWLSACYSFNPTLSKRNI